MTDSFREMELRGYVATLDHGFVTPLFAKGAVPNTWYRAKSWPPGSRKGVIAEFDLENSTDVMLLQASLVEDAQIGGTWKNVFLWDGRQFTGPASAIWQDTLALHSEIESAAPMTMLALSECASLEVYDKFLERTKDRLKRDFGKALYQRWEEDVLLRGSLVREMRHFLGRHLDSAANIQSALNSIRFGRSMSVLEVEVEDDALVKRFLGFKPTESFRLILKSLNLTEKPIVVRQSRFNATMKPYDHQEVHRMLSQGELPPKEWRDKVKELNLSGFRYIHLLPLLPNLERLRISNGDFDDIEPLSELKRLEDVAIISSKGFPSAPFSSLTRLRRLVLRDTPVKEVEGISKLSNLQILDLMNTNISTVPYFSKHNALIELNLAGTTLNSLGGLTFLRHLRELSLWHANFQDLSPIRSLRALTTLVLRSSNAWDISAASDLQNLVNLDMRYSKVGNLASLKNTKSLEYLAVSGLPISDFTPIAGNLKLRSLHASATLMDNLEFARTFNLLSVLNIKNTKVSNLNPLSRLTSLKIVNLKGISASDSDAIASFRSQIVVLPSGTESRISLKMSPHKSRTKKSDQMRIDMITGGAAN